MAWQYQLLLNQCIQILLLLSLGALLIKFKVFHEDREDLVVLNSLVFFVLIPASVILGLGIYTDLYQNDIWRFIGAFLMLRCICLIGCVLVFGIIPHACEADQRSNDFKKRTGSVAIHWLFTSWFSTIILGVPLIAAALGAQYGNLGVVAAVSSFIFQLPLMIILFELDQLYRDSPSPIIDQAATVCSDTPPINAIDDAGLTVVAPTLPYPALEVSISPILVASAVEGRPSKECWFYSKVAYVLLINPVIWATVIGLILSLSTLGPTYLNPGSPPLQPNCTFVPETGFIFLFLFALAGCTEPVALVSTGVFIAIQKNPAACGWSAIALYMVVKLVLVPMVAIGCAVCVSLTGSYARAVVLIASLPIPGTSNIFSTKYSLLRDETVANIVFGTILVLPTSLAWIAIMDASGLFQVSESASTTTPIVC